MRRNDEGKIWVPLHNFGKDKAREKELWTHYLSL